MDFKNDQLRSQGKRGKHLEQGRSYQHKPGCHKNPEKNNLPNHPLARICLEIRRFHHCLCRFHIPGVEPGPQNNRQAQAHGKKSSQDNMKEKKQTERPDSYECENEAGQDQVTIAECQAQVYPSLVGRVSLDEPGTIALLGTFDPGSFDQDGHPASQPGKIAILRTLAKAVIG
jgi:hypothetical protein